MQLPNALLATLRVGLGATALLGSACAGTAAQRGPEAFPGLAPARGGEPTPVVVTVPVSEPKPAPPVTEPIAPPPMSEHLDCLACGMG